jgi:hypothetical protein
MSARLDIKTDAHPTGKPNEWAVLRFYVHPLMGAVHMDAKTVRAESREKAIEAAAAMNRLDARHAQVQDARFADTPARPTAFGGLV